MFFCDFRGTKFLISTFQVMKVVHWAKVIVGGVRIYDPAEVLNYFFAKLLFFFLTDPHISRFDVTDCQIGSHLTFFRR